MDRFIYADNAATTSVSAEVLEAMLPYFKEGYGNPSSLYSIARKSAKAVEESRAKIAELLGAKPNEIYFTASGSEADNWAIKGAARASIAKGRHIITSKIEHHAVLNTMKALEKEGFEITYLGVGEDGLVDPDEFRAALRTDTILATVMLANNEIGTIEPVGKLAAIAHERKVPFFTDAVQAVGHIPVNVAQLGVDMLALSGHKINAPKGIGALYIKNGTRVLNLIDGGGQERGRRGGTENVAYIVGLARALETAVARIPELERVRALRDRLIRGLTSAIPYSRVNGTLQSRLPGNANISFEFIEGESLVLLLDMAGIAASTGSACSSASLEPSHVLLAIGLPADKAHGSLRLTLSHETTDADVDYILEKVPPIVDRLRAMSPLYEEYMRGEKTFSV